MNTLAGRRILVVEDEMMIAMVVETVLVDAGCRIVGPFGRLAAALASAQSDAIDVALLDINLHGELVFPVAEALRDRAIPFVFVTGYGSAGLPAVFKGAPALTKPYRPTAVLAILAGILPPPRTD